MSKWGSLGSAEGQFRQPDGVVTDSAGNVYVADRINNRIQKFTPDGTFLLMWGWGVATGASQFEICSSSCQAGVSGSGDGQFGQTSAYGLAVDAADNVYAADRNNSRIQKFTPAGTFLSKFGSFGSGADQLSAPEGVAVDSSGNIFVAEYSNFRIQKFDASGVSVTMWGVRGTGDGQFEHPSAVTVDPAGNVYVADTENDRVQKFDSNGTFIGKWGGTGTADGQFLGGSRGVTVDGGDSVYVADFNNRRIQQFSFDGAFLGKFGSAGTGEGQFNRPIDVALHQSDIYVSDVFGNSISRFRADAAGAAVPPPVLGQAVNAEVVRGRVLVAVPTAATSRARARASQKGLTFVPLTADRQIPVGSFVDTKRGTVSLVSATRTAGKTQSGEFASGVFQVLQSRSDVTELRLKGASFSGCRVTRGGRTASAAQRRRLSGRTIRRLRSNVKGRFRTRGRHSAATARGTVWLTVDRCDGTLTRVTRGRVAVRDFRRKRTITLRAGKRYLATARP